MQDSTNRPPNGPLARNRSLLLPESDRLPGLRLLTPAIAGWAGLGLGFGGIALGAPVALCALIAAAGLLWTSRRLAQRTEHRERTLGELMARVRSLDVTPLEAVGDARWRDLVADWNRDWPERCRSIAAAQGLIQQAHLLPGRVDQTLESIVGASSRQEEAVEETAALVANMRQSMHSIAERVASLSESSDQSASAILELGSSIDEVANNTATLHEVVEASTSAVHQMGASIRQVSAGAEQVQEMAETTAVSVAQMDRSVQEVSTHAVEAAALTERANQGATAGREAVRATITDIEQISALTSEAMERLDGLVTRISQIGGILSAIDEINDETNLLSLNAAIIAAQAGEQGKAFLVVANHVKTLARRTAGSTQDIERLIAAIEQESAEAVRAMQTGIEAVAGGVARSRDAGSALESIQQACSDASERVAEIARATSEQSRNSKGVAEATLRTSSEIHQIGQAIAEQHRASESMLQSAERALDSCLQVHRSTDEQRQTSRQITSSISAISEMIREIGSQTRMHADASQAISEAVMRLLDNAQLSGASALPLRELVAEVDRAARRARWPKAGSEADELAAELLR